MRSRTSRSRVFRLVLAASAFYLAVASLGTDTRTELHARSDLPAGVAVSDSATVDVTPLMGEAGPGEVQSTVVPPGKKPQCPQGRLLISNDRHKDPAGVFRLDLDNLSATPTQAAINSVPPGWDASRRILSNDHDLIALPDGDVLLIKMGQSKMEMANHPDWWDQTFKLSFNNGVLTEAWGPGARSEILIWRSEDCGNAFYFVSAIDTARIDDGYGTSTDGSGGLPQWDPYTEEPWSIQEPAWQMGGTDGPLARVDPTTGRVFITLGLVGYRPQDPVPGLGFYLTDTSLNRTVVMMSDDNGSNWQRAALLPFSPWRLDVVPRGNSLAFAHEGWIEEDQVGRAFVYPNVPLGSGPFFLFPSGAPEKIGQWGWNSIPWDHPVLYKRNADKDATDSMQVNFAGQTILTRSPSSKNLLLAFMDTIPNGGDGYRLYMYDGLLSWLPFEAISPKSGNADDFALHLTAVDPGDGPVLFYWYDVDTVATTATIRGRLVLRDDTETPDFAISRSGLVESSFDVTTNYWYGDYHTAGAYAVYSLSAQDGQAKATYHYYPVWLQPDGDVRVAHVTYPNATRLSLPTSAAEYGGYTVRPDGIIMREQIDISRLVLQRAEEEEERTEPREPH